MNSTRRRIEVVWQGDVAILTPQCDLRELEFQEIEEEFRSLAENRALRHVVVDFASTVCLGSTAVSGLVRLSQSVKQRGGRIAFCNVSAHEREVFEVVGLANFWPAFSSLEEAVLAVTV